MDALDWKTVVIGASVLGLSFSFLRSQLRDWDLDKHFPAIVNASRDPFSYYRGALKFYTSATVFVANGYERNKKGVFRLPGLFRWEYIVSGRQYVAEMASTPEDVLSFNDGVEDSLQTEWTMSKAIASDPWHISTIRINLTRNLPRVFAEVRDEIVDSFNDVLAVGSDEWKSIPVMDDLMKIVSRTSNRIFVGLPLCREPEYVQLNIDYTINVFVRGSLIKLFPNFLKPLVVPVLSNKKSTLRLALKYLRPVLEERLEMDAKYGKDYPDRPNDLISWMLEYVPEHERNPEDLALRILVVNMAAIHTSSTNLAAAVFDLAAFPEHIEPMREEVKRVVEADGWSKTALNNMHKVDSFIRESQRMRGTAAVAMTRKVSAKNGFDFSDGTHVPAGAFLSAVAGPVHYDSDHYPDATQFDGFRFSRMREAASAADPTAEREQNAGIGSTTGVFNRQMISTTTDHLVFGHGIHACPGRFFAAMEIKAMLAHFVVAYDIKLNLENGEVGEKARPKDMEFGFFRMPNQTARVWVKKRVDADEL